MLSQMAAILRASLDFPYAQKSDNIVLSLAAIHIAVGLNAVKDPRPIVQRVFLAGDKLDRQLAISCVFERADPIA